MNKVFISHATEDSALALKLDDSIRNKAFPGYITTFVSASLESLPAGAEWSTKILEEIRETKIMFCLLGPTTRDRPWIHFEAGAARINDHKSFRYCIQGFRQTTYLDRYFIDRPYAWPIRTFPRTSLDVFQKEGYQKLILRNSLGKSKPLLVKYVARAK